MDYVLTLTEEQVKLIAKALFQVSDGDVVRPEYNLAWNVSEVLWH
jgi:hypothetical protein